MATPLEGIRVVDLSNGPVGGIATMILADFGADVIKVERPAGEPLRAMPGSPMWLRGKRSVVLDLQRADERERLHALAASADVVVTAARPGVAERLGYDADTLAGLNPTLVVCAITGFGANGPYAGYPGYEGVVAAKGGRMMAFEGTAPRPGPQFAAVHVTSHQAAHAAVAGVLSGLLARARHGRGGYFETSMLQGLMAYDMVGLLRESLVAVGGTQWDELPPPASRLPSINYQPVMAADGRWLQLGNLLQHLFDNFVTCAELFEVFTDERFRGSPGEWSEADRETFRDRMFERMQDKPADEWMRIFVEHGGVVATPFQTTQEALIDPDLVLNRHVIDVDDSTGARVRAAFGEQAPPPPTDNQPMKQLGLVARLAETPGEIRTSVPAVGEHTEEVFAALELEGGSIHPSIGSGRTDGGAGAGAGPVRPEPVEGRAREDNPSAAPPLAGITVLDFSTIIATPLGGATLADLGARVIKVEPVGGDPWRWMSNGTLGALKTNAGKESISLDLKAPDGQEVIRRLITQADVILHNFRPGVPERLGIGYAQASTVRPELVYVSMNGYGPDGPSAHRPATHPIPGAALGGALFQAGAGMPPRAQTLDEVREGARRLFRANEVNPDPNVSAVVATAALLGLQGRERTGRGQQIHIDMMGANAWANQDDFFWYHGREPRPQVDHDLRGTGPLYRLYECAEGWVFLGLVQEAEWERFCALTARDDLATDARFATRAARREYSEALIDALSALFATDTADAWEAQLAGAGLGCVRADGPVPGAFFLDDAQVQANGFTARASHPQLGEHLRHGPLVRQRGAEFPLRPAPMAGEQTDAILSELGLAPDEVQRLREAGVAWSEPGVREASRS